MSISNQTAGLHAFRIGKLMAETRYMAAMAWLDDCDDAASSDPLKRCSSLIMRLQQAITDLKPLLREDQRAKFDMAAGKVIGFWKTLRREWKNPRRSTDAEDFMHLESEFQFDAKGELIQASPLCSRSKNTNARTTDYVSWEEAEGQILETFKSLDAVVKLCWSIGWYLNCFQYPYAVEEAKTATEDTRTALKTRLDTINDELKTLQGLIPCLSEIAPLKTQVKSVSEVDPQTLLKDIESRLSNEHRGPKSSAPPAPTSQRIQVTEAARAMKCDRSTLRMALKQQGVTTYPSHVRSNAHAVCVQDIFDKLGPLPHWEKRLKKLRRHLEKKHKNGAGSSAAM